MKIFKTTSLILSVFLCFLIFPNSTHAQTDCNITSCNCEITLDVENNSGTAFELVFGGPGPGFCQTITAPGVYTFTADGDNASYYLQLINDATGDDVSIKVSGCNVEESINLSGGGTIIDGFNTDSPCTTNCSTSNCTCEVTLDVFNNSDVPFELVFGGTGPGFCDTITAEGQYTYIVDAANVTYLMQLINNATGVNLTVLVSGCNVNEVINLGSGNPIIGSFETDDPCITDCSTSDCTCEVTLDVFNNSGVPFELVFGGTGPGFCDTITAEGQYTYTVDAANVTYFMQLINNATGVNLTVLVSGCNVDEVINLGSGNPIIGSFETDDPCDEPCEQIEERCERVDFTICPDGTLTATFFGSVNYVKVWESDWSQDEYLCKSWSGGPSCTGTVVFAQNIITLIPGQSYILEVNNGGCIDRTIEFTVPQSFGQNLVEQDINSINSKTKGNTSTFNYAPLTGNSTNSKFTIYPNPAQSNVVITNKENIDVQVQIFSAGGTMVSQTILSPTSRKDMSLDEFSNGLYYVKFINTNSNEVKTEKLIIIK